VQLEARRWLPVARKRDDMYFMTSLRESTGDFLHVYRTSGATGDALVGGDVENLQTASSSRKNGPVRTRPNSATSSFMM